MIRRLAMLLVPLGVLVASTCGHADTILTADLTNAGEPGNIVLTTTTGAPRPASFGTARFVLNDAQTSLTFTATIFNIDVTGSQTPDTNDNLVAAHIHAGANVSNVPTIVNGGVVWGFFGAPFHDNNPDDSPNANHVVPFASGVGGTFSGKWDAPEGNGTNLNAQLPFLLAGTSPAASKAYINFHTTQFSGGEIRGAILSPEPTSIILLGFGAVAVAGYSWRSRKRTG
jgi:hypothetical protein